MTGTVKKEIKSRSKDLLDSPESGVLNAIKSSIDNHIEKKGAGRKELDDNMKALSSASFKLDKAAQEVDRLKKEKILQGDDQLEAWGDELEEKRADKLERDTVLSLINKPYDADEVVDTDTWSLADLQHRFKVLTVEIAKGMGTVDLQDRTQIIADIAQGASELARRKIQESLLVASNKKVKTILASAGRPPEIERIDKAIHLKGKKAGSVGETLAIGYSFLLSVLNRGKNKFPLVVDYPAGPMDNARRKQVGDLIPGLCHQFVGFTISSEREGFLPALKKTKAEVKYLTFFRNSPTTKHLMKGLPKSGVVKSSNGVLVEGVKFFEGFQPGDEVA